MSSARSPEVLPCSPWECWGKSGSSWYGIISISAMMSTPTLLEAKIHLSEIVPSGFSSDEDDDEDEEPAEETEASPEEVLQYAWETVCYVIWGKASAKGGQKVVEAASEELKELYRQIFIPITENLEGSGGLL